ncbi:MAG: thiolase family protein, partial [Vicinamibacterales bacterium]
MAPVIVSAVRTPVGKAPRGALRYTRPDEMAAAVMRAAIERAPGLDPAVLDDVIFGCAMPEAEQGLNVARIAALRAGVPVSTSAATVNRFCASGIESIAMAAERIAAGGARAMLAGGTESMSLIPMGGHKIAPNPRLVADYPDVYLSTGLVAENHAREASISREEQDTFAFESHQRAVAAIDAGRFAEETIGIRTAGGTDFTVDEGPRRDTSLEALASLKPAFHAKGTVTAGNSSQTSDGAAAVIVMDEAYARELGLRPLARVLGYATAGVEPERFGIGPVPAVRKLLARLSIPLDGIGLVELNEAFAVQVLACLKELPIDRARLNVNGGAIALGHPLGCSGARLTTTLLHEMRRRGVQYGLVTLCVGGGMGAAA